MRPAYVAFWSGLVGLLLAVVFVTLGDVSVEPLDHPAWLVESSGTVLVAFRILCGFCLPGFFLNFVLMAMIPELFDLPRIAGRPGDMLNYVTYPLVQAVLYGGVAWVAVLIGAFVRGKLPRRDETSGTATPGGDAATLSQRRSRLRPLLIVGILVILYSAVSLFLLAPNVPASWTADYDKERYARIYRAIKADRQHLLGKSLEEVSKELGLEGVPWDDGALQQEPGMYRIYHFRGFALYVTLKSLPPGITPNSNEPWTATHEELQRSGVLWLAHQYPHVKIDGITDGQERMKCYWQAAEEAADRHNTKMRQERKNSGRN